MEMKKITRTQLAEKYKRGLDGSSSGSGARVIASIAKAIGCATVTVAEMLLAEGVELPERYDKLKPIVQSKDIPEFIYVTKSNMKIKAVNKAEEAPVNHITDETQIEKTSSINRAVVYSLKIAQDRLTDEINELKSQLRELQQLYDDIRLAIDTYSKEDEKHE